MATLLPRLLVPAEGPLTAAGLFGQDRPLILEIGFGAGEHVLARAGEAPETGFIGVEPFVNGMAIFLTRFDRAPVPNLKVWDQDARPLLDRLPPQSLAGVYLNYPDPWPKRRHAKRRFVQMETLDALARVIKPGGFFKVATDIPDYAAWTLEKICQGRQFRWQAHCPADWRDPPPGWPGTRYEAKAIAAGRRPAYLNFTRQP